MKKLTKILPRRLQGRENGSGKNKATTTLVGPPLESARDHHQLTLRRGIPTKKRTRTGASRIVIGSPAEDVTNESPQGNGHAASTEAAAANGHAASIDAATGNGHAASIDAATGNGHVNGKENGEAPETPKSDTDDANAVVDANGDAAAAAAGVAAQLICEPCAAIGFPRLFDWKPGEARPWVPLAHTLKDKSNCPYCTFFQAMIGYISGAGVGTPGTPPTATTTQQPNGSDSEVRRGSATSTFTPYFRIRHAFERLGISQKHELGRAMLFEVTTKNKSLPRGYILRAADDEGSIEGYLESSRDDGASETGTQSSQPSTQQQPSNLLRGRTVPALLDPALPRCWIDYCKEHHADERCAAKPAAPRKAPLKLVDAENRKVVAAADLDSQEHEFVTLSYALGNSELEPLSEQNDLPANLPALFQDALSLTLSLGYRYIWIDHYCLPLREDKMERRQQLDLLGDVFAGSALTIIAAAGDGVADGIPGISVHRDEDQLSLQNESGLFTTSLLRPDVEVAASTWAHNAWTLQEGLLARRRLVLTPSQVYFQCGALHCHESISIPLRLAPSFTLGRIFPVDGVENADIRSLIGTYMTRELARSQDRLDAFRGLSRAYATKSTTARVDTFMGLPLFDPDSFKNVKIVSQTDRLAVAMSWMWSGRIVSFSQEADGDLEPCHLDKTTPFPSWTWLAWRIRNDQPFSHSGHSFRIPLTNDDDEASSVVANGLCAPPRTEISVGFADGLLVSWEIDGVAISRRAEPITFLRIRTFCFDIKVTKKGDDWQITEPADVFDQATRDTILLLVRSSQVPPADTTNPATPTVIPDGEFAVTALLLTGTNWRPTTTTRPSPETQTPSEHHHPVTALLCAPKEWQPEQHLVRLGVAGFTCTGFTMTEDKGDDDEEGQATLHGVASVSEEDGRKSLETELRELDLY